MSERIKQLRERKKELHKRVEQCEKYKKDIENIVQRVLSKYIEREITKYEYEKELSRELKGKSAEAWISCYDEHIKKCAEQLKFCGSEIRKEVFKRRILQFSVVFFGLMFFSTLLFLFYQNKGITGLIVFGEEVETYTEELELTFEQNSEYEWQPQNKGKLAFFRIAGSFSAKENGEFKIFLEDKLIFEDSFFVENNGTENESLEFAKEFSKEFIKECKETCDLSEFYFNKSSYKLRIELSNLTLHLQEIEYGIIIEKVAEAPKEEIEKPEIKPEEPEVSEDFLENETQGEAVVGENVKWKKTIIPKKAGAIFVKLPKNYVELKVEKKEGDMLEDITNIVESNEEGVKIKIDNVNKIYEITYKTPAPELSEETLSRLHKKFVVSGPADLIYKNVKVVIEIPEVVPVDAPELIVLYHSVKEEKEEHPFKLKDKDGDGLFDEIEWTTDDSNNQEFELIIEIIKAVHLNENRKFVSDIYESVRALDGNWSETIPDTHYVRVVFEQNLTSHNDITLFPRTVKGAPRIEVYEIDGKETIAEFPEIRNNEYNRVLLTNLNRTQNTFDLKILNGDLEFDHIVDPEFSGNGTHDVGIAILNDTLGMFVMAWCAEFGDTANYQVLYTNGSSYAAANSFDTGAGDSCRISISALNSTAFVIAYIDWVVNSADWSVVIYDLSDRALIPLIDYDTDMNSNVDIGVCALNSTRYATVVVDDTDNQATFVINDTMRPSVGTAQIDVDNAVAPDVTDSNLADCAAINQSNWVFAWYDDGGDTISFARINEKGQVRQQVNYTASATKGGVAVAGLADSDGFVLAFCDNTNGDLSFVTYNGTTGSSVSGTVDVDTDIGSCGLDAGTHLGVTAVNSTNGTFAIIYDQNRTNTAFFAVYNFSGSQVLAPTNISTTHQSVKEVAIASYDSIRQMSVCAYRKDPLIVAFNNLTAPQNATWLTFYANGSEWDGTCTPYLPSDDEYPLFSNFVEAPANNTAYSSGALYQFNVTIISTNATAGLEFNGINYTGFNVTSNVFNVTLKDLAAGAYNYYWWGYGNGTSHNRNVSSVKSYTVAKATGNLEVYINGFATNRTVEIGSIATYNSSRPAGEGFIEVFQDSVSVANASATTNTTTPTTSNSINITAILYTTQNYTEDKQTRWIDVNDSIAPLVTIVFPTVTTYGVADFGLNFNVSLNENGSVQYTLDGGVNNVTMTVNNTGNGFNATNSSIRDGTFTFRAYANDTTGNNNYSRSAVFSVDRTLPLVSIVTPANNTNTTDTQIDINFTVSDANLQSCWYTKNAGLNNATLTCGNNITTVTWNEGYNNVTVYANDSLNNVNFSVVRFFVDSITPTIQFFSPTPTDGIFTSLNNLTLNVTSTDANLANITTTLYNSSGLVARNFSITSQFNLTYPNLINGIYFYNATGTDVIGTQNTTTLRNITVDTTIPLISYTSQTLNDGVNVSASAIYVNVTLKETNFANITFTLYNDSSIVNSTFYSAVIKEINWTGLADNNYTYQVNVTDLANNKNYTAIRTIRLDTTIPLISYTTGTLNDGVNVSASAIYVNVTVTETNFANITFLLYNRTSLVNSTTYLTRQYFVNWTSLSFMNYTYNVSIRDLANNFNSTATRNINLSSFSNSAPQIIFVTPIPNTNPTENNITYITFNFSVLDENGASDLNNWGQGNFTFGAGGEAVRQNSTCNKIQSDGNYANFSCTIDMWYFDAAGSWNISVSINDSANAMATNITKTFQYNQLQAIVISPNQITFASLSPGAVNQTSNNDPTLINNTGNYNITVGNIQVTGINLHGTDSSFFIRAANFSVDIDTGGVAECVGGTFLSNGTAVSIAGSVLPPGNNSLSYGNATSGQEQLYYCLFEVSSILPSQTYSTNSTQAWTIRILLVVFVPAAGRAARKKKKKKLTEENLLEVLEEKLKGKYGIGLDELLTDRTGKEGIKIPLDIFKQEIGAAESLCKYLRENEKLKFSEIAKLVKRDQRTVAINYKNATKKMKEEIKVGKDTLMIPISVISDRRLSILESIIYYLRGNNFKNIEIAKMLGKDARNIWTLYSRAMKKLKIRAPEKKS